MEVRALYGHLSCGWLRVVCAWRPSLRWEVGVAGWARSLHGKQLGATGGLSFSLSFISLFVLSGTGFWISSANWFSVSVSTFIFFWGGGWLCVVDQPTIHQFIRYLYTVIVTVYWKKTHNVMAIFQLQLYYSAMKPLTILITYFWLLFNQYHFPKLLWFGTTKETLHGITEVNFLSPYALPFCCPTKSTGRRQGEN